MKEPLMNNEGPMKRPRRSPRFSGCGKDKPKSTLQKSAQDLSDTVVLDSPASPWTELPEFVCEAVVKVVQGNPRASARFRLVCHAWREAHDLQLTVLTPRRTVPPHAREWRKFRGVKTLRLLGNERTGENQSVDDKCLKALAPLMTRLTSLHLGYGNWVTNKGMKSLGMLTTLTSLELSYGDKLTGEGVSLAPLTALTNLDVRSYSVDGMMGIGHLTALTSLHFSGSQKAVTDEEVMTLAPLTSLTSLTLDNCHELSDVGVSALAPFTALTTLRLFSCEVVTSEGYMALMAPLTALTSLSLRWSEITDEGLVAVAGLTNLTKLNLASTCISDFGLEETLAFIGTALTDLNLSNCFGITDVGLTALAGLNSLTSLDLEGCDQHVTGEALWALAPLTALRILDLTECVEFTDDGMRALAEGLPSLTCLILVDCPKITNEGLRALGPLTALDELCLLGCKGVTGKGSRALPPFIANAVLEKEKFEEKMNRRRKKWIGE